jgi:ribosomal protein S12 methylthiotransferase accessory factor
LSGATTKDQVNRDVGATADRCSPDSSLGLSGPRPGLHLGPTIADPSGVAKAAVEALLGDRFGLIRDCRRIPWVPGLPEVHLFAARGPRRIPGWKFLSPPDGTGVSVDPAAARLAAVGEAVERYCAMAPVDLSRIVTAAFRDLGDDAIDPDRFARLSDRQYRRYPRLDRLTHDKVIEWSWSFSLTRRRAVLLPAALVHFSRGGRAPNDYLPELGSSGFAAHVSLTHGVLAGLQEVLERDALTIAWQNRLPFVPLDPSGTDAQELISGPLGQCRARFALYRIPSDSPLPVVMALARSGDSAPHAAVGCACRPDARQAAVKALYEASQILYRVTAQSPVRPPRIRGFDDHSALYATADGARLLDRHLVIEPAAEPLAEMPALASANVEDALAETVAVLASRGSEVLVSDLTTADVASAGFRVIRVVVPGAVDMCADARFPRLGGSRLYDVPVGLGLRPEPLAETSLNLLPVPLA